MLSGQTYTYTPPGEAAAATMPGVPPELRGQVLHEMARLSEMARSIENPKPAGPAKSHYQRENERKLLEVGSARSLRLAGNEREFIAIAPTSLNPATTRAADNETITAPSSRRKNRSSRSPLGESR